MQNHIDLKGVRTLQEIKPRTLKKNGSECSWWIPVNFDTVDEAIRFCVGFTKCPPNFETSIYPEKELDNPREKACMVFRGNMEVTDDFGKRHSLKKMDALYVPPNTDYSIRNPGPNELWYAWMLTPSLKGLQGVTEDKLSLKVIITKRDIAPEERKDKGREVTYWDIFSPHVTGSKTFVGTATLRPPETFAELHGHDPPITQESFLILDGQMQVTDELGKSFLAGPLDAIYIPAYGRHMNKNISSSNCFYFTIETPGTFPKFVLDENQKIEGSSYLEKHSVTQ